MAYNRQGLSSYLNARLEHQFDIGLLDGFLELDTTEMNDNNIQSRFRFARETLNQQAINLFTRQLSLVGDCTSIVARMFALSSVISQKSYSILALTVLLPFVQRSISAVARLFPRSGMNSAATSLTGRPSANYSRTMGSNVERKSQESTSRTSTQPMGATRIVNFRSKRMVSKKLQSHYRTICHSEATGLT